MGLWPDRGNGGDIDDRPAIARHHAFANHRGQPERPLQVQIQHLLPMGQIHLAHLFARNQATCIVNQHIDTAEALDRFVDQCFDIIRVLQIALHGKGLATRRIDLGHRLIRAGAAGKIVDRDIRAFAGKLSGNSCADIAPAASDNRGLSLKFHIVFLVLNYHPRRRMIWGQRL